MDRRIFFAERRAHAPLVAAAEVTYGFGVVVTINHLNRTATCGCVSRSPELSGCIHGFENGSSEPSVLGFSDSSSAFLLLMMRMESFWSGS